MFFTRCNLESLCPPQGLVLEMGYGIAPLMRACMVFGYPCFSPLVVDHILCPLTEWVQDLEVDQVSAHTNSSKSGHDDDGYECPLD